MLDNYLNYLLNFFFCVFKKIYTLQFTGSDTISDITNRIGLLIYVSESELRSYSFLTDFKKEEDLNSNEFFLCLLLRNFRLVIDRF